MNKFIIKQIVSEILYGSRLCESANQQRIVDFFYDHLLLEKLLVGEPVTVPELRKILRNKILNFEFIKLDGEVRPAKGTTMMKYIPEPDHPKGIRPSSKKVATFFDLEKKAWRSVSNRSKEIVLHYAFSEKDKKKKPVFIVRDKSDAEGKDIDTNKKISKTKEPTFSEPDNTGDIDDFSYDYVSSTADDAQKKSDDFDLDVEPIEKDTDNDDIEDDNFFDISNDSDDPDVKDIKAVSTPKIKAVSKPDVKIEPAEPTPKYGWKIKQQHKPESKPEVKPIVRPTVTKEQPSVEPQSDETEVLLPKQVTQQSPIVRPSLPTKEPPLEIDPEDDF